MEKLKDFIPKTYIPILFVSIIMAFFGLVASLKLFGENGIKTQLLEIKSLQNPKKYLIEDTLIIDEINGLGTLYIEGRLKSDLSQKRNLGVYRYRMTTGNNNAPELEYIYGCYGCLEEEKFGCQCLPILRSNIHKNIYINNRYALIGADTKIIADIILETYLIWIVPLLFLYWKITQFIYHYLDKKINAKNL